MNQEERELLQKSYELSKENNEILHGVRRHNRRSLIFTIIYWVLIVGVSIATLYFLQPYIDMLMKAYKSIQSSFPFK